MNNRWSDAARLAALTVRQARALAGRPVAAKAKPKKGLSAPKPSPMVYAGGSATFDERTGKRIPEMNIWIPPPNDPHWNDPAFVESFKRGVAERKKTGLATPSIPKPNIFYSSAYPYGPGQEGVQGIFRYDPKNPVDPSKGGYGLPKKKAPQIPKPRVIIAGKRYTRVGGRLYADVR
jgi:hypothetical protein